MQSISTSPPRDAAIEFLYSRLDYERRSGVPYTALDYRLERMHELLERLGNPQRHAPIVHVAGTKGKGSTSAFVASALSAAGLRTGLYTSPHLHAVEERIVVDGQPCLPQQFVELVERVRLPAEAMDRESRVGLGPTFFDLITAMALLHFQAQNCRAIVLEVGLGGRLDSTNVCEPAVTVITSISFDHTRQLGHTLAEIAGEKAGIVKPGVPTVCGVTNDEPRKVIERICAERGSRMLELGREIVFAYHPAPTDQPGALPTIDVTVEAGGETRQHPKMNLALLGRHQAANAALAVAALAELEAHGLRVPEADLRRGLAQVCWPARIELARREPLVVIDSAHNVASIDALVTTLAESFSVGERWLIFGTTLEKDYSGMLARLLPFFQHVVFTRYRHNPRSADPEELLAIAKQQDYRYAQVIPNPVEAWHLVEQSASPRDLICITGSFFLAAELREEILGQTVAARA